MSATPCSRAESARGPPTIAARGGGKSLTQRRRATPVCASKGLVEGGPGVRLGTINIGSAGNGSGTHMAGELLKLRAGLTLTHIPYKSAGAAVGDVVGGQIQSTMTSPPAALPLAKAGKLKILAAAAAKRSPLMPEVPTFAEAGIDGVLVSNWYSVMAVGGTPQPVIRRLHAELLKALASPELRERLAAGGLEPAPNTPEEFRRLIEAELRRWAQVIKDAGIRQE